MHLIPYDLCTIIIYGDLSYHIVTQKRRFAILDWPIRFHRVQSSCAVVAHNEVYYIQTKKSQPKRRIEMYIYKNKAANQPVTSAGFSFPFTLLYSHSHPSVDLF